jgi:hypothetical protein
MRQVIREKAEGGKQEGKARLQEIFQIVDLG